MTGDDDADKSATTVIEIGYWTHLVDSTVNDGGLGSGDGDGDGHGVCDGAGTATTTGTARGTVTAIDPGHAPGARVSFCWVVDLLHVDLDVELEGPHETERGVVVMMMICPRCQRWHRDRRRTNQCLFRHHAGT